MNEGVVLLCCFTTVRRLERLSFFQEIGKEGGQNEDILICEWDHTMLVRNRLRRWKHISCPSTCAAREHLLLVESHALI